MTINVLAFGIAKDIFGTSSIQVQLEDKITAGGLKALLETTYPRLKQLSSFMLAVNNEYAPAGDIIEDTDEIAVIPPVSGG